MIAVPSFDWDLVVVAFVAAVPATLGAWSARKAQKNTRSTNGGVGVNDDLQHLTDSFAAFKSEVRDQWSFHMGFHHANRDIAAEAEQTPTRRSGDWDNLEGGTEE